MTPLRLRTILFLVLACAFSGCTQDGSGRDADGTYDYSQHEALAGAATTANDTHQFSESFGLTLTQATAGDLTGNAIAASFDYVWMEAKQVQNATVQIEWKSTSQLDDRLRLSYAMEHYERNRIEGPSPLTLNLTRDDFDPDSTLGTYFYQFRVHGAPQTAYADLRVQFTIKMTYAGDQEPRDGLGSDLWG